TGAGAGAVKTGLSSSGRIGRRLRVSTTTALVRPRPISWRTVPWLIPVGFRVRVFLPVTLRVLSSFLSVTPFLFLQTRTDGDIRPRLSMHVSRYGGRLVPVAASLLWPACAAICSRLTDTAVLFEHGCALHYTLPRLPCKRAGMDKSILANQVVHF